MARVGVGKSQRVQFPQCSFSLNHQVTFSNGINIAGWARFGSVIDVKPDEEVPCGRYSELAVNLATLRRSRS